jgi:lipopolysaccharide biosynthesis protein
LKIVAFYLPQFHEIEENNLFWGKGFTEWTNVKKSEALFHGHRQPKLPAYLGYYDLLNEKTIESQMQLASYYGIDVFAVYIYWFNGKSIMDKPLKLLFKFAKLYNVKIFFVWANENWTRKWDGLETDVLLQQEYDVE